MNNWLTRRERRHVYSLIAIDGAIAALSLTLATALRVLWTRQWPSTFEDPTALATLGVLAVSQLVFAYVFGLYEAESRRPGIEIARCLAAALATVAAGALLFFALRPPLARSVLIAYVPLATLALYFRRAAAARRAPAAPIRIATVGLGAADRALVRELVELGYCEHVVSIAEADVARGALLQHVEQHDDIEAIVIGRDVQLADAALLDMLSSRLAGTEIFKLPAFFARRTGRIALDTVDAEWLCEAAESGSLSRRARRAAEAVAALALIIVCLPMGCVIALLIKWESPGPVIFRQQRLGFHERPFFLYRFRTMRTDAGDDGGPTRSPDGDPRVTRVGRVLRARGLDELPQLWNVLRGELSFIGVRPVRTHFADRLAADIPLYRARFLIRPGITGWAQVQHGYTDSVLGQLRKLEYELYYLRYGSPALDVLIVLKTMRGLVLRQTRESPPALSADGLTRH